MATNKQLTSENNGSGYECIIFGIDIGCDVENISELRDDDGPFDVEFFYHDGWQKNTRENERDVDGAQTNGAKTAVAVETTLQIGDRLIGGEEEYPRETDHEQILVDEEFDRSLV